MNKKILELQFATADGKSRTFKVNVAQNNLDPLTVTEAMNQIIAANAFELDGLDLYHARKAARYVESIITPIFEEA